MNSKILDTKLLPKSSGIYRITNVINGNFYIGSSSNIRRRVIEHISTLRHHKGLRVLQRAWDKYGVDNFVVDVVELCLPAIRLDREQHYLDTLNPKYNIAINAHASTSGLPVTHLVREKISKALHRKFTKKQLKDRCDYMRTFKQPSTDEYKQETSKRVTEKWKDQEFREKNLKSRQGKNTNAVVTPTLVLKIRNLYRNGMTVKAIAKKMNLKNSTTKAIVHYYNWKWVKDE